jgi:hypothetical protein
MDNQFETLRDRLANLRRVYEARNEKDLAKVVSLLSLLQEQNEALTDCIYVLERLIKDEVAGLKRDVERLS